MKKRIMSAFGCVMVVFGMTIAGSEGPWFPWFNLVGLLMVAVVAALVERGEKKQQSGDCLDLTRGFHNLKPCERGPKAGRS